MLESLCRDAKGMNCVKLANWGADSLAMDIKEQLCWLFGVALWIIYIILGEDRTGPYSALAAATGYLAIVFIATSVFKSMNRRAKRESNDKADS
jgi:hypothetical protein